MSISKHLATPLLASVLAATGLASVSAAAQDSTTGEQAGHHTMADMDSDKDGRLSRSEFAAAHGGKTDEFAAHDGNGDGFISQAEMDAHHAATKAGHEAARTVQQAEGKPDKHD
jgi:hypothetical protein